MLTKSDLSKIKTTVQETIRPQIDALKKNMATKDDLKGMATKDDLKNLEAKFEGKLETDLKRLEKRVNDKIENFKIEIIERIEESEMEIIATVDKHKEDKETVKVLGKRVDRLEENAGLPPFPAQ